MKRIIYACSTNQGKLREFELTAQEFSGCKYKTEQLPSLKQIAPPAEDRETFEQNAALKALYYSGFTRELVFADDSGLEVEALGGAPGVESARFAGMGATDRANNELLVQRLAERRDRNARFVCVISLAQSGQLIGTFRSEVEGEILYQARGENGFGYDPLFLYKPFRRTFGEISAVDKFRVSHRGQALRKMFEYLSADSRTGS